jgi:hypothetical protein
MLYSEEISCTRRGRFLRRKKRRGTERDEKMLMAYIILFLLVLFVSLHSCIPVNVCPLNSNDNVKKNNSRCETTTTLKHTQARVKKRRYPYQSEEKVKEDTND